MKFHCEKCNTRYSIADERVRGRVLKIRCKACNNVITVREAEAAHAAAAPAVGSSMEDALSQLAGSDDEHTRVSSPSPLPSVAEGGSDDWYVSFDGEQEGPLPIARALDRVRTERPRGKECYCWRGGFFVWLPVEDVPEFAPALLKVPPPIPQRPPTRATGREAAIKSPTGKQPALRSTTGQQAAVKSTTGQQVAVKSTTGQQAAVKSPTGQLPAVKSPTGQLPAVKAPTGQLPAVGRSTGAQPALRSPSGSMGAVKSPTGQQAAVKPAVVSDMPGFDSGPLGGPESMPALVTRPEPRITRKQEEEHGSGRSEPGAQMPMMLPDSGPAVSPFAVALQASGPTSVSTTGAPRHEALKQGVHMNMDSGPVPLPPPPGEDLPIDEPSGLVNLSHLSKPSMAAPKNQAKQIVDTFGGVPVTPSALPTPPPQPIVVIPGRATGAWVKWAALGGAAATVALLGVIVVLMQRKPTVIVVPPAPTIDDGKKVADKPITIADNGPTPTPGQPTAASAGDTKRAQKRPPSSARAAAGVKPASDKDLSTTQRNLASLYRDEGGEHGAKTTAPSDGARGGGGQVSQQAIMAVVTQNRRSLNLCYDRVLKHDSSLKSGRVVTHVKIGVSGGVTGVNVPDPQYANSEIGQCIAQTIRHWHFPSADAEYETEFPIILQAN
ncbi:MAG: family finger-like protein [Myxococcales bacterium]|nr:family finger-like protein [Myxococcales bacterium]